MDRPVCLPYGHFAALRGKRPVPEAFENLWSSGDLTGLGRICIAVVGTRAASPYGRTAAADFAARLAGAGCCIVSGLAQGIDAAAHEGALEAGGPTIGVLGGGHRQFFPRRNRPLAERMIAAGGAVLSPYAPDEPAMPLNFLQRNSVVAALCDAVVVIECPRRSGALNTAGWAAGRVPVFVVPGDIDRPQFAGSHHLIRDGCTLVRDPQDVLDDMRIVTVATRKPRRRKPIEDPLQRTLWRLLAEGEQTLDLLIAHAQSPAAAVMSALSMLELRGAIQSRPGNRYARAGGRP
ncbi:MAG TPA: DNA-protecting protein DprA [Candidatus Baltobacteraceae bacterium]|nr:DNA-protecting protein DprA [Candidatus Baltobacteraceae bacterium]